MNPKDKFILDYVEIALWSSVDDSGEPLDANYSYEDLAPETIKQMEHDCVQFMGLADNIMHETDHPGHDFWLTRNGHGAGFWDGDYPEHGDKLTDISKQFGPCDLYVGDDNLIYYMQGVTNEILCRK